MVGKLADKKKLVEVNDKKIAQELEKLVLIMNNDLALYKDVIQWGAVIFGHGPPVPDTLIIESFYYWLTKIPVSNPARIVGMFFLGMFKDFPSFPFYFEPPTYIINQDATPFKINHESTFIEESVNLTSRDISKLNVTTDFKIVNEVVGWIKSGYEFEQMCVLAYLAGITYNQNVIKKLKSH